MTILTILVMNQFYQKKKNKNQPVIPLNWWIRLQMVQLLTKTKTELIFFFGSILFFLRPFYDTYKAKRNLYIYIKFINFLSFKQNKIDFSFEHYWRKKKVDRIRILLPVENSLEEEHEMWGREEVNLDRDRSLGLPWEGL